MITTPLLVFFSPFIFAFILVIVARKPFHGYQRRKKSHYHRTFVNKGRAH